MNGTEPPITEWDPTPIIDERLLQGKPYRFSLVILNQPIHNIPLFLDLWKRATVRIAADGGANRVYAIRAHLVASGPKLDFIVGDLDSLEDTTRAWFLSQWPQQRQQHNLLPGAPDRIAIADTTTSGQIVLYDDQDSTDFGKAMKYTRELARRRYRHQWSHHVRRQGPEQEKQEGRGGDDERSHHGGEDIICYSGLGGRVDQAMSQLHHLYMFQQRPPRRSSQPADSSDAGVGEEKELNGEEKGGYADGRMYLTNGESLTFVLLAGQHRIRIRGSSLTTSLATANNNNNNNNNTSSNQEKPSTFGKHVGIIPLTGPSTLTTRGLEWDVTDWRTAFGERLSTSNHTTPGADVVEVKTSRDVLFTIDVPVLK